MLNLLKHAILLLLCTLFVSDLSAQKKTKETHQFLKEFFEGKAIIYTKGIPPYESNEIIESLKQIDTLKATTLIGNKRSIGDILILNKNEKKRIIKKFENQKNLAFWENLEIAHSIQISLDTINSIFKNQKKSWTYFNQNYGKSYTSFSFPVFLRNNRLCVFYCDFHWGEENATGEFAIYRKEKGRWKKWIIIFEWIA